VITIKDHPSPTQMETLEHIDREIQRLQSEALGLGNRTRFLGGLFDGLDQSKINDLARSKAKLLSSFWRRTNATLKRYNTQGVSIVEKYDTFCIMQRTLTDVKKFNNLNHALFDEKVLSPTAYNALENSALRLKSRLEQVILTQMNKAEAEYNAYLDRLEEAEGDIHDPANPED
jgi:hypothetical protein